jgi:Putative bacterial sensory transduction regulator/Pyridine nucleotide-disulphide oxidoreductase
MRPSVAVPSARTWAKVVIIGAGFGGIEAAKSLRSAPVEVTVIDRQNHHCFQPLLYQVATAAHKSTSPPTCLARRWSKPQEWLRPGPCFPGQIGIVGGTMVAADSLCYPQVRQEFVTENQRPQVRTGMAGYNVVVYFSGCEDDGSCGSLQYSLGIAKSAEFTLTMVNSWNQKKRFAKAYLDAEGNLLLQADVYFDDVTKETVDASARLFDQLAGEFRSMVSSLGTAR